jgi:hypothetical protein
MEKPDNWLTQVPDNIRKGIRPGLLHLAMFLIENTHQEMTVGMSDIGFPGYISNCRVYDWEMLVNKNAKDLYYVLKSNDKEAIKDFIFSNMRENLESHDPDFFFYHLPDPQRWREKKWVDPVYETSKYWRKWSGEMLNEYFNKNMDVISYEEWQRWKLYGRATFVCYRKKGLTYQPSISELIKKYEKIIRENPGYPAFKERLQELYRQAGREAAIF